jgi:general stress protein YciG
MSSKPIDRPNFGFGKMSPEKHREASRRGGASVPKERRPFAQDRELARLAASKGGQRRREANLGDISLMHSANLHGIIFVPVGAFGTITARNLARIARLCRLGYIELWEQLTTGDQYRITEHGRAFLNSQPTDLPSP